MLIFEKESESSKFLFFFEINLYFLGNYNLNEKILKIWICGLLFLVFDIFVFEFLENLKLDLKSKILYEKIRYLVIKRMMSVLNGNCFVYVVFFFLGIFFDRVYYCVGLRCFIFYYG